MVDELFAFKERLRSPEITGKIVEAAQVEIAKREAEGQDKNTARGFSGVVGESATQLNRIETEVDVAERTLELSISAYNELHMAYPLHVKYRDLITQLEDYRDDLADLRDEVTLFPATFHDISTTSCN